MGTQRALSGNDRNRVLLGAAIVGGAVLGGIIVYRSSHRGAARPAGPKTSAAAPTSASASVNAPEEGAAAASDGGDDAVMRAVSRPPPSDCPSSIPPAAKAAAAAAVDPTPPPDAAAENPTLQGAAAAQPGTEPRHVHWEPESVLQSSTPGEAGLEASPKQAADANGNGFVLSSDPSPALPPLSAEGAPPPPASGAAAHVNTTSAAEDRKQLPAAQLPPAEGFVTASVAAPTAEGATPGVGVEAAAETPEALEASEDESAADAAKVSQLPYTWYQDLDDVTLHTSAVEVGSAREVSVSFRARSLRMVLRGQPVVDGKLTEAVHPEECTWQFEEVRGERRVVVTLAKATRGLWRSVIQGDPQLDLAALATLSGYNDRKQAGGSHRLQCFEE